MNKQTTVIILHPDLEFSLIKFQKELIHKLNSFIKSFDFTENAFFYAVYPLWIFLQQDIFSAENKEDLKKISKKIINVTFDDFTFENDSINICVKIKTIKNEYYSKLTIAKLYKIQLKNEKQLKNQLENFIKTKKTPFCNVKIFRLGICNKISENSQDITEFVWVKKNS